MLVTGWGAILIGHLRQLDRFTRWAASSRETSRCPTGSGPWAPAFSALYRRVRMRMAYQRDLAHTIERFQSAAEAIPDGMVVLDAYQPDQVGQRARAVAPRVSISRMTSERR